METSDYQEGKRMQIPTPDDEEARQPLLADYAGPPPPPTARMTALQKAISLTFRSTADLANHLPTGTALAFRFLSPVFVNVGPSVTAALLAICALSCFLLSLTDSFPDPATGRLRYGFATVWGLWMIDGLGPPAEDEARKRRLVAADLLHAVTSLVVFAGVALLEQNVVACFYPEPSEDMRRVLAVLPVGVGALASALLITFPTTRRGIGFPATTPAQN